MKHMRIRDASRTYRALLGDDWAKSHTKPEETEGLIFDDGQRTGGTPDKFTDFIRKNQIELYESVVRNPGTAI